MTPPTTTPLSAPRIGTIVFWTAVLVSLLGFVIPSLWAVLLSIIALVPLLYGSHEALHETLFLKRSQNDRCYRVLNATALIVGFGLQFMNFRLMRPAHFYHHMHGRYDEGYAPDVFPEFGDWRYYLRYYLSLCGRATLLWQIAGFFGLLVSTKRIPFAYAIRFDLERSKIPFCVPQLFIVCLLLFILIVGGWEKFLIYELALLFVWSVLQNVSHYGLKGIDPITERVCARTYFLEKPFHYLTFGSTSHLAHHVDDTIPGLLLTDPLVIRRIEERLGVQIEIKRGIIAFLADVLRQFKGPVPATRLDTSWIRTSD